MFWSVGVGVVSRFLVAPSCSIAFHVGARFLVSLFVRLRPFALLRFINVLKNGGADAI